MLSQTDPNPPTTADDATDASTLPILTFALGQQVYALPVADLVEVVAMVELAAVPDAPPYLLGAANRHGEVLPIIDLRRLFDLPAAPISTETFFIVATAEATRAAPQRVGLVVDHVDQVKYIPVDRLRPAATSNSIIQHMVSDDGGLIQIIALGALLAQTTLE